MKAPPSLPTAQPAKAPSAWLIEGLHGGLAIITHAPAPCHQRSAVALFNLQGQPQSRRPVV